MRLFCFTLCLITTMLCISCNSNTPSSTAGVVKVEMPKVDRWEYKQVFRSEMEDRISNVKNLLMNSELNSAGDGWELVCVTHVVLPVRNAGKEYSLIATFRRPKS